MRMKKKRRNEWTPQKHSGFAIKENTASQRADGQTTQEKKTMRTSRRKRKQKRKKTKQERQCSTNVPVRRRTKAEASERGSDRNGN